MIYTFTAEVNLSDYIKVGREIFVEKHGYVTVTNIISYDQGFLTFQAYIEREIERVEIQ